MRVRVFFSIVFICLILTLFVTRGIHNYDHPLRGEALTTPFFHDILGRCLHSWDDKFSLGYSNTVNSPGAAPYASSYSGAIFVPHHLLSALLQKTHIADVTFLFIAYATLLSGIFLLSQITSNSRHHYYDYALATLFVFALIVSSNFYTTAISSLGKFTFALGLTLIILSHHLKSIKLLLLGGSFVKSNLFYLAFWLLILLYFFNPYFIALMAFFALEFIGLIFSRKRIASHIVRYYLALIIISMILVFIGYSFLSLTPFVKGETAVFSGAVGRQASPLPVPLLDIITLSSPLKASPSSIYLISVFPFIVLMSIVFSLKNVIMRHISIIYLLSLVLFIILLKGSAEPIPALNQWIHESVPFMSLFGSSYPYFAVVHILFIYFLLVGTTEGITFVKQNLSRYSKIIIVFLFVMITVIQYRVNPDFFSGNFGRRIQDIYYPQEYYDFKRWAEKNLSDGRSYYFPDGAMVGSDYQFSPNTNQHRADSVYSLPFSSTFPVNIDFSNYNSYSGLAGQYLPYFIKNHITNTRLLSKIFAITNTKYIIFDNHIRSTSSHYQRFAFIHEMIKKSADFKLLETAPFQNIEIYINQNLPEPRLFGLHTAPIVVAGDLRVYEALDHYGIDITRNPLLFVDQLKMEDIQALKDSHLINRVVFYDNDLTDVVAALLRSRYELTPDKIKYKSNSMIDWVTYNSVYRAPDVANYGMIFSGSSPVWTLSSTGSLVYRLPTEKGKNFVILARLCLSPSASTLHFNIGSINLLTSAKTMKYAGLKWLKIGEFKAEGNKSVLAVTGQDAETNKVIDSIIVLPEEEYNKARSHLNALLIDAKQSSIKSQDYTEDMSHYVNGSLSTADEATARIYPSKIKLHVLDQRFEYSTRFGIDDRAKEGQSVAEQLGKTQKTDARINRWQHEFHSNKWLLSMGRNTGEYSLVYELESPSPFENLRIAWDTSFLSSDRTAQIFASYDEIKWFAITKRLTSDVHGEQHDISSWVKNRTRIFLKFSHFKMNASPFGTWITAVTMTGNTSRPIAAHIIPFQFSAMNRNRQGHYDISGTFPKNNTDTTSKGIYFSEVSPSFHHLTFTADSSSLLYFNSSYSANWLLGNRKPIPVNFYGNGYIVEAGEHDERLIHASNTYYRLFLLVSASLFTILLAAVIVTFLYQRKR